MKLLDVRAVLDRETDVQQTNPEREVLKELGDKGTCYAILSHRWGAEVGYKEMIGLMKMEERKRDEVKRRDGYQKIIKSCEQAAKDGYEWLWIDTCCIDKRSSSELSEAINSMYQWYQNAQVCYAYLNDVDELAFPDKRDVNKFDKSNGWPEWFARGWTLQELIAPKEVVFFNKGWVSIGNKGDLANGLEDITGIPGEVLSGDLAPKDLCVAQIMSWAAERETTRVEDRAYSLMGLFGVNMPMLYGEGKKAFRRLQLEIIRTSNDHSIFAWNPRSPRRGSVLADDPSDFWECGNMQKVEPDHFGRRLIRHIEWNELGNPWYIRNISTNPIHRCRLAWLRWRGQSLSQPLRTFIVSNAGIQVCLPVVPFPSSPNRVRALLACDHRWDLPTIDLEYSRSSFHRTSTANSTTDIPRTVYPEFKTLHLTLNQDANETPCEVTLDDKLASYHGFARRGTFPRKFTGEAVTLSSRTNDLIVVVYANDDVNSRFAVGLGYYDRHFLAHVVSDRRPPTQEADWMAFAKNAYDRMWKARAKHARSTLKGQHLDLDFIKHAHLAQSIWDATVAWRNLDRDDLKVMVGVGQCPGCCYGPCECSRTYRTWSGFDTPKFQGERYRCTLDGRAVGLEECSGQQIALGDYGDYDYSNGNLKCIGNILEDARTHVNSVYCPVVSSVVGSKSDWDNHAVIHPSRFDGNSLMLRQPKGLSLPTNECLLQLLQTLSNRAAGKHLVMTVIQCSDFYRVDYNGKRMDSGDASDSGDHSTEPRILTPLYTIASPQVWRRQPPYAERRERFQSIREHFYSLMNMDHSRGPEAHHSSANRQKADISIKFFSDIFGLPLLRNYVGKITFFERLPWMMETNPLSEDSVGNVEARLFKDRRQSNAAQDPRLEVVLPLLGKRCRTLDAKYDGPRRYADEMQKVTRELESISQTLSADLVKYMGIIFKAGEPLQTNPESSIEYDRHLDTSSMVQEIEALCEKLNSTEDEDEQRALEEDITGKILWLCWCGTCAEVDELLPQVVDYIGSLGTPRLALWAFGRVMDSFVADPDDDPAHLQRIMFDAGAGTSKHQLLLDARAAEQAKWSGTTALRGTANTNTQGPSTSS